MARYPEDYRPWREDAARPGYGRGPRGNQRYGADYGYRGGPRARTEPRRPGGREHELAGGHELGRRYDRGFRGGYAGGTRGPGASRRGGYARRTFREAGPPRYSRSRVRASEIMTPDPETVTPDAKIADVARRMRDLDVGIMPVVEGADSRRLRGVITDRDMAIRALAEDKGGNTQVKTCMSDEVYTVNQNDDVSDVLWIMRTHQVRRVPVVDRENRLVGIIAQADLALDYGERDREHEIEVEEAIERVSEPGHPRRGRA